MDTFAELQRLADEGNLALDANAPATSTVNATFFTTSATPAKLMPETTFAIPIGITPEGLSTLVNSVLALEGGAISLDFLVNDEYLSMPLEKFMRRRRINAENVLQIEYTPALRAHEGAKLPHEDWVSSVRAPLLGVSTFLATSAYDHCVRTWNGDECLAIGTGHVEPVKQIAINMPTVVAGTAPEAASTSGKVSAARKRSRNQATSETPIAQSFQFASVGKDGSLRIWQYQHGDASGEQQSSLKCISSSECHTDSIDTVDVSWTIGGDASDATLVATGGWDNAVKVYDWNDLVTLAPVTDPKAAKKRGVGAAAMTKNAGVKPLFSLTDHARGVLSVRFAPNTNRTLYSTGLDGNIKVWDVSTGKLITSCPSEHSIQTMSVKPGTSGGGSDLIVTGHTDSRLRLHDLRTKKAVHVWSGHRQWIYGCSWLWRNDEREDNTLLASTSEDATVRVWDMRSTTGALVSLDKLHADGVLDVTYVGNSEIASAGKDNKTKTFSLRDGNVTKK